MRSIAERALAARVSRLPPETDAFRWIDGELTDLSVDLFADVAILSTYREVSREEELAIASELGRTGELRAVYLKRRPKEARRAAALDPQRLAPPLPLWGTAVESLTVSEQGARFEIRPPNGLSVGLYLDARDARGWVKTHAASKRVLNLFAYTCGFGVSALLGGAQRVVNIDCAKKALDWGRVNYRLNQLRADDRDFVVTDALDWLGRAARKGEVFELVILDPPGFASTRRGRFTLSRDYHRLVAAAAAVTAPGGVLFAMCNVDSMSMVNVAGHLRRGLGPRKNRELARFSASEIDFRRPSLKCLGLELRS